MLKGWPPESALNSLLEHTGLATACAVIPTYPDGHKLVIHHSNTGNVALDLFHHNVGNNLLQRRAKIEYVPQASFPLGIHE